MRGHDYDPDPSKRTDLCVAAFMVLVGVFFLFAGLAVLVRM